MTKEQKERLMREWLNTPASLRPKRSRVSRSKRAINKADKAVVRSTSVQIQRGEEAAQLYLHLKNSPDYADVMENMKFADFRKHWINKEFKKKFIEYWKKELDFE